MSMIRLTFDSAPVMGKQLSFVAPCSSLETEALIINDAEYMICDAEGLDLCGRSGIWTSGAVVSVILDTDTGKAYIQNPADPRAVPLWWNADPNSSQPEQSIQLGDVSAYSEYIVQVSHGATQRGTVGQRLNVEKINLSSETVNIYSRNIHLQSDGCLRIRPCYMWGGSGNPSLWNDEMRVLAVYGVKGVL